jgi:hypothetical protein
MDGETRNSVVRVCMRLLGRVDCCVCMQRPRCVPCTIDIKAVKTCGITADILAIDPAYSEYLVKE